MYAGAVATLIFMIIDLATLSTTRRNIEKHAHHLTAAGASGLGPPLLVGAVAGGLPRSRSSLWSSG
jgi:hypothetical protein